MLIFANWSVKSISDMLIIKYNGEDYQEVEVIKKVFRVIMKKVENGD